MKLLKTFLLLLLVSQTLQAQNPYLTFLVSHTNYDYLGSSNTNNIVFKTDKANLLYMISPFNQMNSRFIINFSGPNYVGINYWFDSLNVFNEQGGFPNIDYGTTGSTNGMIGISSETNSKIAIVSGSGVSIKNSPPNPVFVFSNGKIFLWSKSQSKLYRSDDLGNLLF